jgi:methylmalonyl-CoA mutase
VLFHESGLGHVADPAGGSYLLEKISLQIADQAWALFLEIEDKGGLMKCIETGFIERAMKVSLNKKLLSLNTDRIIVGVNKFTEAKEKFALTSRSSLNTNTFNFPDLNFANLYQHSSIITETI